MSRGGCVLKTYIVLGDELHELHGRMGDDTVCVFTGLVVDRFTLRVQITCTRVRPLGVKASEVETMRHRVGVATSAT